MDINNVVEDDKDIVSISGKINALTAPDFEKYLKNLVESGSRKLILDFSDVEYVSSAGLRSVLIITKMLKSKRGSLILASLQLSVKEVFEISGFTAIIPVVSSLEEARSKI